MLDGLLRDSDGDDVIDDNDDITARDGTDLVIDLDPPSVEGAAHCGSFLRAEGVSALSLEYLVPIPPPAS